MTLNKVLQVAVDLGKYALLLAAMIAGFKYWFGRDACRVATDDDGMRPAIGNSRVYADYDRHKWTGKDLKRGDVVIALSCQPGQGSKPQDKYPFRVVAVAGDWLEVKGGICVVNGQQESYPGVRPTPHYTYQIPRMLVPRGYVFLLSDNRAGGMARPPELVPVWRILGKARV